MGNLSVFKTGLVVRAARNVTELEALLRVRYTVYNGHALRFVLQKNEHGLDVDPWDKHAMHLGLYKQSEEVCQPIGYMRFVNCQQINDVRIKALGLKYPDLSASLLKAPPVSHPCMKGLKGPLSSALQPLFSETPPGKLAETSRFVVLEEERSPAVCRFLMEAGTAICLFCLGMDTVFEVNKHHTAFYTRYGFQALAQFSYTELPWETTLIYATAKDLGLAYLPRLRSMAEAFWTEEEVWLQAVKPNTPEIPQPLSFHLLDHA